jgi:hypothetical protein
VSISALVITAGAAFAQQAIAMQITFVQPPAQSPAQSRQNRTQPQTQEGLSPEKKKSLSKYGPEDIFPAAKEQEKERGRNSQPVQKAQSPSAPKSESGSKRSPEKSVTAPSPITQPSTTPIPTPTPIIATSQPTMTTPGSTAARQTAAPPSPTINAGAMGQQTYPMDPARQSALFPIDVKWNVPILSGMALAVFAALIYVLSKLREKIRVGSGG